MASPPAHAPRRPSAPRWLVGDWTRLIRDPADLLRLSILIGAAVAAVLGNVAVAARLILTFLAMTVPRLLEVPRPFDFAFGVGMSLQAWGNAFDWFATFGAYNKIVHFCLPLGVAPLLYLLLVRLKVVPDLEEENGIHKRIGIVLVTFAFGFAVGGIYEIYEWFADNVLGGHLSVGYGDTIGDLADDALGATCGGLLLLMWDVYGWGTRRRVTIHE